MDFIIEKGKHYSNQYLYKLFNFLNLKRTLSFNVKFTNSCRYNLFDVDQEDDNKLFGFSLGFDHHKYSARFGWFYENEEIYLSTYTYDNGIRKYEIISKVELNKFYQLSIIDNVDNWVFIIKGDKLVKKVISKSIKFKYGYKLWPYFGGNESAPHDIIIEMTK